MPMRHLLISAFAALLISGCIPHQDGDSQYGLSIDNPLTLKLTWFHYLAGSDIRRDCGPLAPDVYRFVYNGHYNQQLRSYEVTPAPDGGARVLARVLVGSGIQAQISLNFDDVLASWRWTTAEDLMSGRDFTRFTEVVAASGVFKPSPEGLRLYSNAFYWVASACRDGRFYFNAWVNPSARYDRLEFPRFLLLFDGTGVAVNPPRARDLGESVRAVSGPPRKNYDEPYFVLEVGENGLEGL